MEGIPPFTPILRRSLLVHYIFAAIFYTEHVMFYHVLPCLTINDVVCGVGAGIFDLASIDLLLNNQYDSRHISAVG